MLLKLPASLFPASDIKLQDVSAVHPPPAPLLFQALRRESTCADGKLSTAVQRMDPSRLVNPASGWYDAPAGDVIDVHDYVEVRSPRPTWTRAAVLGEYGGLGHKVCTIASGEAVPPCCLVSQACWHPTS